MKKYSFVLIVVGVSITSDIMDDSILISCVHTVFMVGICDHFLLYDIQTVIRSYQYNKEACLLEVRKQLLLEDFYYTNINLCSRLNSQSVLVVSREYNKNSKTSEMCSLHHTSKLQICDNFSASNA